MASIYLPEELLDVGDATVTHSIGKTHIEVGDGEITFTNEEWHEFREEIL